MIIALIILWYLIGLITVIWAGRTLDDITVECVPFIILLALFGPLYAIALFGTKWYKSHKDVVIWPKRP